MKKGLHALKEGLNDSTKMASKLLVSTPLWKGLSFSQCSHGWGVAGAADTTIDACSRNSRISKACLNSPAPIQASQFLYNL